MGTVKKIGAEYYIEFEARGLKYQQKAGRDAQAARQLLERTEAKIRSGEMGTIVRDADTDIFFHDFLEFCQARHTLSTAVRFQKVISHFSGFLKAHRPKDEKLSGLTPAVIQDYKLSLQKNPSSRRPAARSRLINFTLLLLFEVFQYAIKLGYLNDNPVLHVPLIPLTESRPPRCLDPGEIQRLLESSPEGWRPLIALALAAGLTAREVVHLQWADIDKTKNCIVIKENRKGEGRRIPVSAPVEDIMSRIQRRAETDFIFLDPAGRPGGLQDLAREFQKICQKSRIPGNANFYALRHTFVRDALRRGMPAAAVYKFLGLSDIARMTIYLPFIAEQRQGLYVG